MPLHAWLTFMKKKIQKNLKPKIIILLSFQFSLSPSKVIFRIFPVYQLFLRFFLLLLEIRFTIYIKHNPFPLPKPCHVTFYHNIFCRSNELSYHSMLIRPPRSFSSNASPSSVCFLSSRLRSPNSATPAS